MSLIEEVFAAVPPDQWSGAELGLGAQLCAALARPFPGDSHERAWMEQANRRADLCAELLPQWRAAKGGKAKTAIAARYGMSYDAVRKALIEYRKQRQEA